MDLDELNTEVQNIVKRPDLTARIASAIQASILKLHSANFYPKDISEQGVEFPYPNVITNFDPRVIFTRYRHMAYIRIWNYDESDSENLGSPGALLEPTDLGNIVDYYGYNKLNIYYEAGNLIQVRTKIALDHCLIGVYLYPDVTTGAFDSWIAREFPWIIIYDAAARILNQIGDSRAKDLQAEVAQQLITLNMQSTAEPAVRP